MLQEWPDFEWVFKSPDEASRGHATSMNIIARLTQTRYLVYLEDDWVALKVGLDSLEEPEH
jgi:hypothetical protein